MTTVSHTQALFPFTNMTSHEDPMEVITEVKESMYDDIEIELDLDGGQEDDYMLEDTFGSEHAFPLDGDAAMVDDLEQPHEEEDYILADAEGTLDEEMSAESIKDEDLLDIREDIFPESDTSHLQASPSTTFVTERVVHEDREESIFTTALSTGNQDAREKQENRYEPGSELVSLPAVQPVQPDDKPSHNTETAKERIGIDGDGLSDVDEADDAHDDVDGVGEGKITNETVDQDLPPNSKDISYDQCDPLHPASHVNLQNVNSNTPLSSDTNAATVPVEHMDDVHLADGERTYTLEKNLDDGKLQHQQDLALDNSLHPITVNYQDSEMYLFPPRVDNDSACTYLLADSSLAAVSIDKMLLACRDILGDSVQANEQLELEIHSLGLHLFETSPDSSIASLADLVDLYLQLNHNDSILDPDPLCIRLSCRTKFSGRLETLYGAAADGVGISEVGAVEDSEFTDNGDDADGPGTDDLASHKEVLQDGSVHDNTETKSDMLKSNTATGDKPSNEHPLQSLTNTASSITEDPVDRSTASSATLRGNSPESHPLPSDILLLTEQDAAEGASLKGDQTDHANHDSPGDLDHPDEGIATNIEQAPIRNQEDVFTDHIEIGHEITCDTESTVGEQENDHDNDFEDDYAEEWTAPAKALEPQDLLEDDGNRSDRENAPNLEAANEDELTYEDNEADDSLEVEPLSLPNISHDPAVSPASLKRPHVLDEDELAVAGSPPVMKRVRSS